jgi:PilZ domain
MGYMTSQYRKVAPARIEQREVVRHPVLLQRATVRRHSKAQQEARLVDLSIYGCRLLTDATFKLGDRLWVRFSGGNPICATAVWREGDRLGCRFDEALDRVLFRELTLLTG